MFGLLNIDKPQGLTSRDVVNRVQRLVRPARVGHAGTLDPLATGVLVVAVGPATRLIQYVQRMKKRYLATFLLGRHSETEDTTGEVRQLPSCSEPTEAAIRAALPEFVGEIEQVPSAYSALKIRGTPAYKLARRGEQPVLSPRRIVVHEIQLIDYCYPQLTLDVLCGSGTYIRALGRDLAQSMGTAAVMSALVRTAVGSFDVGWASTVDDISADSIHGLLKPAGLAVAELPCIELDDGELRRLANGLSVTNRFELEGTEIAAFDRDGLIRAIVRASSNEVRPTKCFPES